MISGDAYRVIYPKLSSDTTPKFEVYLNSCSETNKLGDIAQGFNKHANDLGGINYGRENHERKNGGS